MRAQDAVRNRQILVLPQRRSDQNAVSTHGDRIRQVAQAEGVREGSWRKGQDPLRQDPEGETVKKAKQLPVYSRVQSSGAGLGMNEE